MTKAGQRILHAIRQARAFVRGEATKRSVVRKVGRLAQRGPILVLPADGAHTTLEEADAALRATREREP